MPTAVFCARMSRRLSGDRKPGTGPSRPGPAPRAHDHGEAQHQDLAVPGRGGRTVRPSRYRWRSWADCSTPGLKPCRTIEVDVEFGVLGGISPTTAPCAKTRTRSANTRTSSSSDDVDDDAAPRGQPPERRQDLGLGSDVDATRRLVDQEQPGRAAHLPSSTFCWLPPERLRTGVLPSRALEGEEVLGCSPVQPLALHGDRSGEQASLADPASGCRYRPCRGPAPAARPGASARSPAMASAGPCGQATGLPSSSSDPTDDGSRPGQRPQERGPPGAHETPEPDDLAASDVIEIVGSARGRDPRPAAPRRPSRGFTRSARSSTSTSRPTIARSGTLGPLAPAHVRHHLPSRSTVIGVASCERPRRGCG